MKTPFFMLSVVLLALTGCDDKEDDIDKPINNPLAREWYVHPEEKTEAANDPYFELGPDDDLKSCFIYAPIVIDWKTTETYPAMGDPNTQWSGREIAAFTTEGLKSAIFNNLQTVKFNSDGTVFATTMVGEESVVQECATYKVISDSVLFIAFNEEFLSNIGEGDSSIINLLLPLLSPYLSVGLLVDYGIYDEVIEFSVDEKLMVPALKAAIPLVATIEVPEIKEDFSNYIDVLIIQMVKEEVMTDRVIDSTTDFDVVISLKSNPIKN